jgi:hypothetical protein
MANLGDLAFWYFFDSFTGSKISAQVHRAHASSKRPLRRLRASRSARASLNFSPSFFVGSLVGSRVRNITWP